MKERIFSGAVLLIFLAAVVLFNDTAPFALHIAVAVIAALAVYELMKAMQVEKKWYLSIPSILAAAGVSLTFEPLTIFAIYSIFAAIIFAGLIIKHKEISFKEIAVVLSMVTMIPLALRSLISLRNLSESHGMFYVLIAILAAWGSDAGAYFAGTFFGKRKLCPEISPKKTVEGFIGGVVTNIVIALLCGLIFTQTRQSQDVQVVYWVLALIGLVGSLTSVLGDLSFSLIKRSCHIKDFGQVIPGHGGVLDRFDSVIFTVPFVYLIVAVLPILTA
ncbi:phosphatidate cytidylyltransferase [Scatolibacter rhodanostii]|uniref:phosphatidate cytidylyltransferase n=1 Tax=Scatolibacter rhodanostii TaxID=2014781 RepID=UPI000C068A8F|nr:CDP-archaeol synthase [Scatolibacter rhodanostii]